MSARRNTLRSDPWPENPIPVRDATRLTWILFEVLHRPGLSANRLLSNAGNGRHAVVPEDLRQLRGYPKTDLSITR